jgi:two-component system, chemotaxis family, protein-glutamate methylesterase/glutaminase
VKTRVMLVDGRPIRSAQIANRLQAIAGIEVVATCLSTAQAERCDALPTLDLMAVAPGAADAGQLARLEARLAARGIRLLPYPAMAAAPAPRRAAPAGAAAIPSSALADGPTGGSPPAPAEPDPAALAAAIAAAIRGQPAVRPPDPAIAAATAPAGPPARLPLVCIGASTGGLPVLQAILEAFPAGGPPTVIVQHIRGEFSAGVASRLDRSCHIEVREAYAGAPLRPGRAYLAPGDSTHLELRGRTTPLCQLVPGPKVSGHRPSVDALFRSAARQAAPALIGVLLTGMGRDGAEGLLEIRRQGGSTIAQDSATSTVYGMPRAAVELGAAQRVLPAGEIARAILDMCATAAEATTGPPS